MKLLAAVQLFRGLADRTRVRILNVLAQTTQMTGTDMAHLLKLPRSTVARHLRYLYRSRLVTTEHRHGETRYALRTEDEAIHAAVLGVIVHDLAKMEGLAKDNQKLRTLQKPTRP